MSAPIPSFFKIRCVLVILSLLLFFMLIGMTRQVFADGMECGSIVRDWSANTNMPETCEAYSTSAAMSAAMSAAIAAGKCSYTTSFESIPNVGSYKACFRRKVRSQGPPLIYEYPADIFAYCIGCPDVNQDGVCDGCYKQEQDLARQCGSVGYTMIDEENCKGRCNDCIAEAEEQCPEPNIIVWNDDGDCSYNCTEDTDGDGWPDIDDPDDDNDGMDDDNDPCPTNSDTDCVKPSGPDTDGDGTPDVSDPDADMDGDGLKNSEDDDDDGDGVKDVSDGDADPDGDGTLNIYDNDDDGDGIPDVDDPDADPDGDGKTNDEDPDDDNDNVPDVEDPDNDKYKSDEPAYTFLSTIGEQFSERLTSFIDEMKNSSIFSIPSQIFGSGGIPTGGSPFVEFDGGDTFGGQQVIDLSNWSSGLAVMRSALYVLFAAVAIKIALTGR